MITLGRLLNALFKRKSRTGGVRKALKVALLGSRSNIPLESRQPRKKPGAAITKENAVSIDKTKTILAPGNERRERIVVKPRRKNPIPVVRQQTAYWEDKGWSRSRQAYSGYFGSNGYRCPGWIGWSKRGLRYCYIKKPPRGLWNHSHRGCFSHIGEEVYSVHFQEKPETIDATIMSVEKILSEATGRRK
ncbi:hypothetical protein ACFLYB_00305 [Chloroflexota bacterium]